MITIATQYPLQSLQLALLALSGVAAIIAMIIHESRKPKRQERARAQYDRLIEAERRANEGSGTQEE